MERCHHADISACDITCECTCDACADRYVDKWEKMVVELDLCRLCGLPNDLNPTSIIEHQHVHFFDPCEDCLERFQICMAIARLCESCHSHMDACQCDHSE